MQITNDLSDLVKIDSPQSRQVIPPPFGLTPFQEQLQLYRRCYQGKLFDNDGRRVPWGQRYDDLGRSIDRKTWKPVVRPAIAKIMAHTHQAYLVGADKMPSLSIVSKDPEPFPGLEPLPDIDNPELAKSMAQKRALQTFLDELMCESDFQQVIEDATLEALTLKEQPVLLRFYGGLPFYTLPDRLWCDWGFSDINPRELAWFEEKYFFKRKEGKKEKEFLYRRYIDASRWSEWEIEVTDQVKLNDDQLLEMPDPLSDVVHNLGFVPVTIVKFKQSLFADEMVDNIKGYIEYRNNIMSGVSGNMDPQRVLLNKPNGPKPKGKPGDDDAEALQRGALWELEGDSITSFANDTEGYKVAQVDIAEAKDDLFQAARVLMIPPDNEQSGRALTIRMAPQFAETMRLRNDVGKAIQEMGQKLILSALKVKNKLDCPAPTQLKQFKVQLDWGQLIPVTPEDIKLELENTDLAVNSEKPLISTRTARRYIGPYFGIEDQGEEDEQIEKEQLEARERQQEMIDAAAENTKDPTEKEDDDDTL